MWYKHCHVEMCMALLEPEHSLMLENRLSATGEPVSSSLNCFQTPKPFS